MNYFLTYDLETYPNIFTFAGKWLHSGERVFFEISDRRNDSAELYAFLLSIRGREDVFMVGYNSFKFDYPILHEFILFGGMVDVGGMYRIAQDRIADKSKFDPIPPWKHFIKQIDLLKLNHFDNHTKRTSLKQIEFNYRINNIIDLPFKPGSTLNDDQKDVLIHYNVYGDVDNTERLLMECMEAIEFRLDKFPDLVSANDGKLGERYLTDELEKSGYTLKIDGQVINTRRDSLALKDVLFNYHNFEQPEFSRILNWFGEQVLTNSELSEQVLVTKGLFKGVTAKVDGFEYVYGLGGIHGSVESQTVHSDQNYIIEDWDVASYYPNLAIANNLYPAHLGSEFCSIYKGIYELRKQYPKKSHPIINALLKLALNTAYGNSNNRYSVFYDPAYTMATTINGQLLLCKLSEELIKTPGLQMIQINTDGLTVRYPRKHQKRVHAVCKWWEQFTCLQLESVEYRRMFIKDVNNYIGEYLDGSLKNKGAYLHNREHYKNHSAMIVPKVAELALTKGVDIERTVKTWPDFFDFQLRVRGGANDHVLHGGEEQQRLCRYYVSKGGEELTIVRPPPKGKVVGDYKKASGVSDETYNRLNVTGIHNSEIHTKNESVYGNVTTRIEKGHNVTLTNDIMSAANPVDYDYYINRVLDLVTPLR